MAQNTNNGKTPVYNKSEKKFMRTMLVGGAWLVPTIVFGMLFARSCSQKEFLEDDNVKQEKKIELLEKTVDDQREQKVLDLTKDNAYLKGALDNCNKNNAGCNCGCTTVNECKCNNNNNGGNNNNNNNNNRNNNRNNGGKVTVERKPVKDTLVVIHQFPETPIAEQPRVREEAQLIVENVHSSSSRTTEVGACAAFDKVVAQRNEYSRTYEFANNK